MEAALQDYLTAQQNRNTNLGSNVKAGDTYAFINRFGIAKKYNSINDFTATAGKNSCGSDASIPIDRTWPDVTYPIGTPMTAGVPCGYENSYITSSVPSSVNGTTMLSGMTQMGNVGYVDVDNTLHSINSSFLSTYKSPVTSYIHGKNMISCLGGTVHYGDPIHIKFDTSFVTTESNILKTSSTGVSTYYLQPVSGTGTGEIKYGDSFILSVSNTRSTSCTLWGCNVGSVSSANKIELSNSYVPFKFIPQISSNMNTSIKINESMALVAYPTTNTLINNTDLKNSYTPYLTSSNEAYTLKFNNGVLAVYDSSGSPYTTLYTMTSPSTTSYLSFESGQFVVYSSPGGSRLSVYPANAGANPPYKGILCNNGSFVIVDGNNSIYWPTTATAYDIPNNVYATETNSELVLRSTPDYKFKITSPLYGDGTRCELDGLKDYCTDSSNCVGFIHSSTNNNWGMINKNDLATNYQIINDSPTNVYLREQTVGISGSNCPTNKEITYVPWYHMVMLPKGSSLPSTGAVCPAIPPLEVSSYNTYLSSLDATWNRLTPIGETVFQTNLNNLTSYNSKLSTANADYNNAYNNIVNTYTTDDPINNTLKQRIEDSSVLDDHFKSMAILWGVISVSIIAIIIFRPNN